MMEPTSRGRSALSSRPLMCGLYSTGSAMCASLRALSDVIGGGSWKTTRLMWSRLRRLRYASSLSCRGSCRSSYSLGRRRCFDGIAFVSCAQLPAAMFSSVASSCVGLTLLGVRSLMSCACSCGSSGAVSGTLTSSRCSSREVHRLRAASFEASTSGATVLVAPSSNSRRSARSTEKRHLLCRNSRMTDAHSCRPGSAPSGGVVSPFARGDDP
mmetsp:Transcript_23509/g.62997  ORF Transcript_23509/g.62997 Transcript_23509/m.62997 type:complete len:213 (-) Transcript_23509:57-695(-)